MFFFPHKKFQVYWILVRYRYCGVRKNRLAIARHKKLIHYSEPPTENIGKQ